MKSPTYFHSSAPRILADKDISYSAPLAKMWWTLSCKKLKAPKKRPLNADIGSFSTMIWPDSLPSHQMISPIVSPTEFLISFVLTHI